MTNLAIRVNAQRKSKTPVIGMFVFWASSVADGACWIRFLKLDQE